MSPHINSPITAQGLNPQIRVFFPLHCHVSKMEGRWQNRLAPGGWRLVERKLTALVKKKKKRKRKVADLKLSEKQYSKRWGGWSVDYWFINIWCLGWITVSAAVDRESRNHLIRFNQPEGRRSNQFTLDLSHTFIWHLITIFAAVFVWHLHRNLALGQ